MFYHINIKKQIQRIWKNMFKIIKSIDISISESHLVDVYDGYLYKKLLENSEIGHLIKNKKAFTLLLNTDGISICKKSKLSIWPIYLCINEIPIQYRYCIENVIVAGNKHIF